MASEQVSRTLPITGWMLQRAGWTSCHFVALQLVCRVGCMWAHTGRRWSRTYHPLTIARLRSQRGLRQTLSLRCLLARQRNRVQHKRSTSDSWPVYLSITYTAQLIAEHRPGHYTKEKQSNRQGEAWEWRTKRKKLSFCKVCDVWKSTEQSQPILIFYLIQADKTFIAKSWYKRNSSWIKNLQQVTSC